MTEIVAINLTTRQAYLSDARMMPIVTLFDSRGQETDDAEDAISVVAGEGDNWFVGVVDRLRRTVFQ